MWYTLYILYRSVSEAITRAGRQAGTFLWSHLFWERIFEYSCAGSYDYVVFMCGNVCFWHCVKLLPMQVNFFFSFTHFSCIFNSMLTIIQRYTWDFSFNISDYTKYLKDQYAKFNCCAHVQKLRFRHKTLSDKRNKKNKNKWSLFLLTWEHYLISLYFVLWC